MHGHQTALRPKRRVGELADAVLARCDREVVGDGLADETTLGPLHTAAGRNRVDALVADAKAHGATVRTAGRIRDADAGAGATSCCRPWSPIYHPTRRWPPRSSSVRYCRSSATTTSTRRWPQLTPPSSG
ncbi:aldehyde dehydrogenase family protein [Mycobacterium xenopi 3993]|nr:aldehyde dehydrogenase family protein [Mycobacterium xenopi 3993]